MSVDRAAAILERFTAAHTYLVSRLRELPPSLAEQAGGEDAWSAAQIASHVAMANDWTASVLLGAAPLAHPVAADFREQLDLQTVTWTTKTFPLEPPEVVSCDHALEQLRASGHHLSRAIASLSSERGAGYAVTMPIGTLSLFELAEYAVAHVARHSAQLGRKVAKSY
jgi:hypothetical protein